LAESLAHPGRQLVDQRHRQRAPFDDEFVGRLPASGEAARIARHDHAAVDQQPAVAVLGQAGQRIETGHADAGPHQRLEQRVAQPLAQLVERHPVVGRAVAAVGFRFATGPAVRPDVAERQALQRAAGEPDRRERIEHRTQHLAGRDLAGGRRGTRRPGQLIEQRTRAPA
jgi:hypothetical protein